MIVKNIPLLFFFIACITIVGCSDTKKKPETLRVEVAKLMPPFRYQKSIEIKPGLVFDVLSWGRGSNSVGSFLILRSDSTAMRYTTTTGDLDGQIVDVLNTDLDVDGNPEIIIQAKANDTTTYAEVYAFEFNQRNEQAHKLNFPQLTKSQKKGYKGDDRFYIEDGKLMREFPLIPADSTSDKRRLRYSLVSNSFRVALVGPDGLDIVEKHAPAPVVKQSPKSTKKHVKKAVKKPAKKVVKSSKSKQKKK